MKKPLRPKIVILFGARTLGLFALSRYLTKSRLRILCYHAGTIGDESGYNPKLFCSAKTLRERMVWMKRKGFRFVTLDDGVTQQEQQGVKAPLRTVVTFDDGWYSTASELLPVLSEMQIPSTLYLCTLNFLEGWPILNVTVRYIIWKAGMPSIRIQGWGTGVDGEYDLKSPAERNRLVLCVVNKIEASANERGEILALLGKFAECLGVPSSALQFNSRRFDYLNKQELIALARLGCNVELHGHVHDYPKGNPAKLVADLRTCAETIVGLGLREPLHYCYPSGSFGAEASGALSSIGVRSATTCVPGLVGDVSGERRHYLPRFLDGEDVHRLEFEAEMSGFSELIRGTLKSARPRMRKVSGFSELMRDVLEFARLR